MKTYLAFFHLPCLAQRDVSHLDGMIPELLSEQVNDLAGRIHVDVNRTFRNELSKSSPFC
jgi:hypothetical protein